jgi:predicted RNA-binding protein YlxR (DUF448 family)
MQNIFSSMGGGRRKFDLIEVPLNKISECTRLHKHPLVMESLAHLTNAVGKSVVSVQIGHDKSGDKLDCVPLNTVANNALTEQRKEMIDQFLTYGMAVYRLRPNFIDGPRPMMLSLSSNNFEYQMVEDNLSDVFKQERPNKSSDSVSSDWKSIDYENQVPDTLRSPELIQLFDFMKFMKMLENNDPMAQLKMNPKPNDPTRMKNEAVHRKLTDLNEVKAKVLKNCQNAMDTSMLPFVVDVMDLDSAVRMYVIVDVSTNYIMDMRACPRYSSTTPRFNPFTGECDFNDMRVLFSREYVKVKEGSVVVLETPVSLSFDHINALDAISKGILMALNDATNHRIALSRKEPEKFKMLETAIANMLPPDADPSDISSAAADVSLNNNLAEIQNVMRQVEESYKAKSVLDDKLARRGVKNVEFHDSNTVDIPKASSTMNPLILPPNYDITALPKMIMPDIIWKEKEAAQENVKKMFGIENIASTASLKNSSVEQLLAVSEINNAKRAEQLIKIIKKMFLYLTFDMYVIYMTQDCLHALEKKQRKALKRIKDMQEKQFQQQQQGRGGMIFQSIATLDDAERQQRKGKNKVTSEPSHLSSEDYESSSDDEAGKNKKMDIFAKAKHSRSVLIEKQRELQEARGFQSNEMTHGVDYEIKISKLLEDVYEAQLEENRQQQLLELHNGIKTDTARVEESEEIDVDWFRSVFNPEEIRKFTIQFMGHIRISVNAPLPLPNSMEHLLATWDADVLDGPTMQKNLQRAMNITHKQQVSPPISASSARRALAIEEKMIDLWHLYSSMQIQQKFAPEPVVAGGATSKPPPASSSSKTTTRPKRKQPDNDSDSDSDDSRSPLAIASKVRKMGKDKKNASDRYNRRPTRSTEFMGGEKAIKGNIRQQKPTFQRANDRKNKPKPNLVGANTNK